MNYSGILREVYEIGHQKGQVLGLDRIGEAARRLSSPHQGLAAIQVAGTNGKGTVCAMVEAGLRREGKKTGMFTSPHLHRFTERIRVDGVEADEGEVAEALGEVLAKTAKGPQIPLTFFEVATLAALLVFKGAGVDVAILEVGLGGRLDATSVVRPMVGLITSVGIDHTAVLGDTIGAIAKEKAGIARAGIPLLCGALHRDAASVVKEVASEAGTAPEFLGTDFVGPPDLRPPWPGGHHLQNAALAHEAYMRILESMGERPGVDGFSEAIGEVIVPARFEMVDGEWLIDGAHNLEAARALAQSVRESGLHIGTMIFGALADKPFKEMLDVLGELAEHIILVSPPVGRAFDARAVAGNLGLESMDSASEAIRAVRARGAGGVNLVTGSFFTAAQVRAELLGIDPDPPIAL